MNKPPGYYRDEKGREYYWDGERRSYVPKSSMDWLNENSHAAISMTVVLLVAVLFLWGVGSLVIILATTAALANPLPGLLLSGGWCALVWYLLIGEGRQYVGIIIGSKVGILGVVTSLVALILLGMFSLLGDPANNKGGVVVGFVFTFGVFVAVVWAIYNDYVR